VLGGLIGAFIHASDFDLFSSDQQIGSFYAVCTAASVFRMSILLLFLPLIKEVRDVEHAPARKIVYRLMQVRPFGGSTLSFISRDNKTKKHEI